MAGRVSGETGFDLACPGFQLIQQYLLAAIVCMARSQRRDFSAKGVEAVLGPAALRGRAHAPVVVPACACGGGRRIGPIARAIAEEELRQTLVTEAEDLLAQGLRRGGTYFGELAVVAFSPEAVVE